MNCGGFAGDDRHQSDAALNQEETLMQDPEQSAKFFLMSYNATNNIGDEIQSLAARQFLPRVDYFVDRERTNSFRAPHPAPVWGIMNGWFCHHSQNWPPSESISPFFVSMHIVPYPIPIGVNTTPREVVLDQFAACWEELEDPRTGNAALNDFNELLIIALCTVLCGGQGAVDMGLFARAKEPFLRGFLKLSNGLPSHDTFSRLFRRLDPEQFRKAFQRFMTKFSGQCQGVVAIDGKVLRRSFDRASGKSPLHMVSAWGCEQRLVLAQIATDAKSNEITAVPKLLEMLSLKGTIVTTDALNCQRAIAQQIIHQGGDYALALKSLPPRKR
jgi:hypothetical protein